MADLQSQQKEEMTPIFASERLDWANAIGLFIINFGMLDYLVSCFCEKRMKPQELAKMRKLLFRDRITEVKKLVEVGDYSREHKHAFAKLFARLEPLRQLRNHIAHGHILVRVAKDGKTPVMTLSLPKDADLPYAPETRHLDFDEVCDANTELSELIEQFQRVCGDWQSETFEIKRASANASPESKTPQKTQAHLLDGTTLSAYCDSFLGFGQPQAPVWFVGIEEAGGWSIQDVERRLSAWKDRGRRPFEDALLFYPLSGNPHWHGKGAVIQKTWRQLIRMLLIARGRQPTEQDVLAYQKQQWGTPTGNTCFAELLPLPSPSTSDWNYGPWSGLRWLKTRDAYLREVRATRENELRRQIEAHRPRVVIFYGLKLPNGPSLLPSWSSIAGGPFAQAFPDKILMVRETPQTTFYVTRHPCAESDDYFREIGEFLFRKHGGQI